MTVPTVVMMAKKKNEFEIDAGYTYPEHRIDELLELAGADNGPESRTDLLNALQLAHLCFDAERESASRQRLSSKQIEQLEHSIEKTRKLLRRIRRYDDFRNIGFVSEQLGRGIVAPAGQELPPNPTISDVDLIFPRFNGDGKVVAINVEPLLRAALLHARRRRRRRGGPKNLGKEAVVFYAHNFFRRHSHTKPSTDPYNPFHEFVERFYEVVTKTKPDSLDRQIRNVCR